MIPDTKYSLLVRIRDPENQEAWNDFVAIYAPVIFRMARHKGLQDSDADDLVQQILMAIGKTMQERPHDPERAKFRTWLRRVAKNAILNALTRQKPDRGTGDTDFVRLLHEQPEENDESMLLRKEYQQELFRRAAEQIRPDFSETTWAAFWRTSVDGEDCQSVADDLNSTIGNVYAARCRVMKKFNEKVQSLDL